tara:strand:- start:304 stop:540 length:237 start_codon:yes stop_codon:yes gene_type:complete
MVNTQAQATFTQWVENNKPEQYSWWKYNQSETAMKWDSSWTYREMYEELGGTIETKTGNIKDMKPKNHSKKIKELLNG